jgi:hypothetical protein
MKHAAPQQQHTASKGGHRRPGPAPQFKAAMGRPYGLNHVAIGPAENGLEAQASRAASMAVRGQRNLGHGLTPAAPAAVSIPSRGMPLPTTQRAWLEPAFGADLRAVRIHHDADAATAARAEHAHAFTAGRDIYFGDGCYQPHGEAGRILLAHEVAHVLQQTGSTDDARRLRASEAAGSGEVQRVVVKKRPGEQPAHEATPAMQPDDKRRRKP